MALLLVLQESRGQALAKDYLSEQVWGTEGASDELIARHISKIRQALGDDTHSAVFLETIPKVGYRLLDTAESVSGPVGSQPSRMPVVFSVTLLACTLALWLWLDKERSVTLP